MEGIGGWRESCFAFRRHCRARAAAGGERSGRVCWGWGGFRFVSQNWGLRGGLGRGGGEDQGFEGLEEVAGFRRGSGGLLPCSGGRLGLAAVAELPEHAQGALVLALEHRLVALEELEDVGRVGEGTEGLGLDFAGGEAAGGQVAGDEGLDEVGFDAAEAAEAELGVGHLHDEVGFGGALWGVFGEVGVAEGDKFLGVFVEQEGGLGEEAVFEGVLRGAAFAFRGFGAGGFLRVGAAGGELFFAEPAPGFGVGREGVHDSAFWARLSIERGPRAGWRAEVAGMKGEKSYGDGGRGVDSAAGAANARHSNYGRRAGCCVW